MLDRLFKKSVINIDIKTVYNEVYGFSEGESDESVWDDDDDDLIMDMDIINKSGVTSK